MTNPRIESAARELYRFYIEHPAPWREDDITAILSRHFPELAGEVGSELAMIDEARQLLETIVCTVPPDEGVVLLSNEGPTHYDAEANCQVYNHEYFSPLGDALIALHKILTRGTFPLIDGKRPRVRQIEGYGTWVIDDGDARGNRLCGDGRWRLYYQVRSIDVCSWPSREAAVAVIEQYADEVELPCPVCGNEVRTPAGYLQCECPAPKPTRSRF